MKTQKDYWDNIILEWEESILGKMESRQVSFVERVAQRFRGPIQHRKTLAFQIICKSKPKRVLELGCGSGLFAMRVVTNIDDIQMIGVDIADPAIKLAQERAETAGLSDRLTFIRSSIEEFDLGNLPDCDLVLGLGLIPYLTESEFNDLFGAIKDKSFFFDVHPKGLSLTNFAHAFYRAIKKHPFYTRYSKREILAKFARLGVKGVSLGKDRGVFYIQRGIE